MVDGSAEGLSPTARTTLRRYPERARSDRVELYRVLDESLVCFLGAVVDGSPRVTPMVHSRIGDTLYLHGSTANQSLVAAKNGGEVCVTAVAIDALILATSMFHHSLNFRSAIVFGVPRVVQDPAEQVAALRAAVDHLAPGRSAQLGDPTAKQLAATLVLGLSLREASVKVRDGWPNGDDSDYDSATWAGVLPLVRTWGAATPDPKLRSALPIPDHVSALSGAPALYG